ncbi:NlpC/P60 family protein [Maritalea porphyrae]|uniref:NlpC/P60 family protein n=1 Tax=Maritalea porphyrae TaxID=880732 RepID=UPI0024E04D00|nr:NlpC/P60 family protein [Maritalea porphyrae]
MSSENSEIVSRAREWLGTPYRHQSATKGSGCDCLGLIVGIWRELFGDHKFELPPYSRNWRDQSHAAQLRALADRHLMLLEKADLKSGQVVLLRMHTGLPAKHCAIVTEPNRFIHAQERVGVVEVPISNWWRRRIVAQFEFPERT